jgi:hypothetical protein
VILRVVAVQADGAGDGEARRSEEVDDEGFTGGNRLAQKELHSVGGCAVALNGVDPSELDVRDTGCSSGRSGSWASDSRSGSRSAGDDDGRASVTALNVLVDGIVVGRVSRIPVDSKRRSGRDSSEGEGLDKRLRRVPSEVVVGRDGKIRKVAADVE